MDWSWDKRPHFGTVGDLISKLQELPPDMPLALSVYGHTYIPKYDRTSSGPLQVEVRQTATANGPDGQVCMIWTGDRPKYGYLN